MSWLKRNTKENSQTPDYSQYGTVEGEQFVHVQVPIDHALVETQEEVEVAIPKPQPEPVPLPTKQPESEPVTYKIQQPSKVMDVLAPWEVGESNSRPSGRGSTASDTATPRFLPDVVPSY